MSNIPTELPYPSYDMDYAPTISPIHEMSPVQLADEELGYFKRDIHGGALLLSFKLKIKDLVENKKHDELLDLLDLAATARIICSQVLMGIIAETEATEEFVNDEQLRTRLKELVDGKCINAIYEAMYEAKMDEEDNPKETD